MTEMTKVVVIDDELILRNGIKYLCNWQEHGFIIVGEASNGFEGLDLIESLQPDIVITDIVMSAMDGIEFSRIVKEKHPEIHIIILSSYDKFDYVKSLFKLGIADYLLKPALEKEELLTLMKKLKVNHSSYVQSSASQFFKELLQSNALTAEQCLSAFQERSVRFTDTGNFILLTGKISEQQTFSNIYSSILKIITKQFEQFVFISCISDSNKLCILIQPQASIPPVKEIEQLSKEISSAISKHIIFACSGSFAVLNDLFQQYQNSCQLLEYSFYLPNKYVLYNSDIQIIQITFPQKKIEKYLDPLNLSNIKFILHEYLDQVSNYVCLDVFTLKKQIEGTFYMLIQFLSNSGFDMCLINQEKIKFFKEIDNIENYLLLGQVIDNIFDVLCESVKIQTLEREHNLLFQIREYILNNCHEELKLSDVAQAFHLNYTYLSTLFNQKTDEHFPDYVNKIRIEKAKHLLQTERISIQIISEKCGFISQGYFAKIFNKYTHMSPREYQKIYKNGLFFSK